MLDTRITDFASLVALILVLLTLFTAQRYARLQVLGVSPQTERDDAVVELTLDIVLIVFTGALFLAGLPIMIEALEAWHPRSFSGPLRGGFVITWLLLVGLLAWQALMVRGAAKLLRLLRPPASGPVSQGKDAPAKGHHA